MKTRSDTGYIWESKDWPDYTHRPDALARDLTTAESAIAETLILFRKLPVDLENEVRAEMIAENARSTSRIEGEIFNADELRASALHHLDANALSSPKKTAATGANAIVAMLLDAVSDAEKPLTAAHLSKWREQIFAEKKAWKTTAKKNPDDAFRTGKVFVVSHRGYEETIEYEAPPPERIPAEIKKFVAWCDSTAAKSLAPLIRAGIAHLWFETLHPFSDGNGRVGRALIDRTLVAAYGPDARAIAVSPGILRDRDGYYAALKAHNRADALDSTPWLRWFLKNITDSALHTQNLLSHVQSKARFWLRHRTTTLSDKQRKVVNRLADAGPGGFEGGLTNRKYIALTGVSNVTAYRDLADLVARGILLPVGAGRSRAYTLNLE